MTAFKFHQRRTRRWWYAGATLVASAFLVVFFVASSSAVVNNSPSGFESSDGNMTLENLDGLHTDWNCFDGLGTGFKSTPAPSGQCGVKTGTNAKAVTADANGEVQWVGGQKFDTQCPSLNTGNNPPKDEFVNIASYNETAPNRDVYFYGATIRATANGNSSGDVEFDQNSGDDTTNSGCRTTGDRLVAYDFLNGGSNLSFHVLTWINTSTDTAGGNNNPATGVFGCFVKNDVPPCWGAAVIVPDPNGGDFEGHANNTAAILAADNGISGATVAINQFAEFGVNLTKVLGLGSSCVSFPQQQWESRSSGSSFTSNPQDIELEHANIQNCGEIKIIKQTDPRGQDKPFPFTSAALALQQLSTAGGVTCSGNSTGGVQADGSFCLNDTGNTGKTPGSTDPAQNSTGNTVDETNVQQGTYTVSEGTAPSGYTFKTVTCTADATSGSGATTSSKTATITLKPNGVVTCVYVNQLNTASMSTLVSSAGPVFPGAQVRDTATVTGNQATLTPGGTVTFYMCSYAAATTAVCDGTTGNVGTSVGTGTLSGTGAAASANGPFVNTSGTPLLPGRYCFRAEWLGDTNYPGTLKEWGGSSGTNECFTVATIPTTTTTAPSVGSGATIVFGSSVTDHAVVAATQSGDGTPTGTVAFFVCDPSQVSGGACPDPNGSAVATNASGLTAVNPATTPPSSFADSVAITANKTGKWCFRAVYTPGGTNGSNYSGSNDSTSGECFTVTDTTGITSAQNWLPNDAATVTATNGAPLNGTLSDQLYTGSTCGVGGGAAVSGQSYSTTLTNATALADRTVTTANTTYTVSVTASVSWKVVFTSTDTNVQGFTKCESSSLTVTN